MAFVTLPDKPIPNQMQVTPYDPGVVQKGAASVRVDRAGGLYNIVFGFPLMDEATTRRFTMRFERGQRLGLQIRVPTLYDVGYPGTPVVDGADQTGSTINLRGFEPGYIVGTGFWFTLAEADGTAYLHRVFEGAIADANGDVTGLEIEPPLRAPFADGDTAEFAQPYMQGFVPEDSSFNWTIKTDKYSDLAVTVEEFQ